MAFHLPVSLEPPENDEPALKLLRNYYERAGASLGPFTGAAFDTWDSTGMRSQDADLFTADDLVAITFLSVRVGPRAAYLLLHEHRPVFSELLRKIGPDRDLVDETETLPEEWPGWTLDKELMLLPDVGPTIASKLVARKRPRLIPIYDSVVSNVLGTNQDHWESIRVALRRDDRTLHNRLLGLKEKAHLPVEVSALRVLDVIAWMEGKGGDSDSVVA
jgi:hypothetical protein